ncbi:hypothetical protein PoB_005141900 [Plakobranchus ocellatus]|uniref:Uncharacterized protein n=1 Tax=Plakobranchus ocellatus TaxID=259542 RepID=A0AAV4C2L6_9GAST|nr:hypothetical protein PoB_005141900 [Plakobranchus ocellatus]
MARSRGSKQSNISKQQSTAVIAARHYSPSSLQARALPLGRSQTAAGSWAGAGSWKLAAGGSWSASHGASVGLFS